MSEAGGQQEARRHNEGESQYKSLISIRLLLTGEQTEEEEATCGTKNDKAVDE